MRVIMPNISNALQVVYLQDHLHRSCKISQRKMYCQNQGCRFDASNPSHAALWRQVFPAGDAVSVESVSCSCQPARSLHQHIITARLLGLAETRMVLGCVVRGSQSSRCEARARRRTVCSAKGVHEAAGFRIHCTATCGCICYGGLWPDGNVRD